MRIGAIFGNESATSHPQSKQEIWSSCMFAFFRPAAHQAPLPEEK
jgi:hypothetical protein